MNSLLLELFAQHRARVQARERRNRLLKKDKVFKWTEECQKAFDTLKQRFTTEPVLMMPDQARPFQIEADASKYASGAVLTQMDSNGDRHPVAFYRKLLMKLKGTMRFMIGNYLE